jgi:hypothetical protein
MMKEKDNMSNNTINIELTPQEFLAAYALISSSNDDDTKYQLLEAMETTLENLLTGEQDTTCECDCCDDCCDNEDDVWSEKPRAGWTENVWVSDIVDLFPVLVLNDKGKATSKLNLEITGDGEYDYEFYLSKKGEILELKNAAAVVLRGNTLSLLDEGDYKTEYSYVVSDKSIGRLREVLEEGVVYDLHNEDNCSW